MLRRKTRTTAYLVALAGLCAPSAAHAQVTAPAPAAQSAPAVSSAPAPSSPAAVATLQCVDRCGAAGTSRYGSLLRVRGKALKQADEIVFLGAAGDADDVVAEAVARRTTSADVRVPLGAVSGPIAVVDRQGALTAPSVAPLVVEPSPPSGPFELGVRAPRAFFGAAQPAALTYVVRGAAPADVSIDLARRPDGVVIAHWDVPQVAPEVPQRVTWDGMANGKVQRTGTYEFRVTVGGVVQPPVVFDFARDRFPVLGKVTFGTGAAAFGGGRGHQGHDVFAACGTPLVAAHAGVVKFAGWHARAGNYVVIDNHGTDTDYVYMHLRDVPLVATGATVFTGQPIGYVGDTGVATGCHLHFEAWTAPGWQSGGSPINPLAMLRSWAANS